MHNEKTNDKSSGIVYSCYHKLTRDGEHFVPFHTLSYQISGSLVLTDGNKEYASKTGSFRLIRRNQLLKFIKKPPASGEFQSITMYLDQQTLKDFSQQHKLHAERKNQGAPVVDIQVNESLQGFLSSLQIYSKSDILQNNELARLKLKEMLWLLVHAYPKLKTILFDFTQPHKIDLEAFMNKNHHFNVKMERFAFLTGRSLAAFKRDFENLFGTTPGRWLLDKRLKEAYYLIEKKDKKPSDIYLDLGFEDLSHFSFAFKKLFGKSPSQVKTGRNLDEEL